MLLIEAKLMHTLTDLVNENLKRNLLHNIVLTNSEVIFLSDQLQRLGTIGTDAVMLDSIIAKLNISRYDK
jgi:hypothetical protein